MHPEHIFMLCFYNDSLNIWSLWIFQGNYIPLEKGGFDQIMFISIFLQILGNSLIMSNALSVVCIFKTRYTME